MRPLAFSLLRELSHEHFTSGARLAEKYGVSRSAISDALRDASESGIEIFSLTRKGYRPFHDIQYLEIKDGKHNQETWAQALPSFLKWAFGKRD